MEVRDLEDEIQGLQTRINNIDNEIDIINSVIAERTAGEKEAKAMIKKYEKQQENVKNSREFEAINKEIEIQDLDIKLAEKHIKDSNEDLQEKSFQHENINKTIAGKEKNLDIKKGELDKIIADNEKEEKHLNKDIEKARQAVEERLLAGYERIRKSYRNGLAVVPIVRDSCGGCFNSIPPQRQSEIKQHKKVIVCENCGRILVDTDLNDSVSI
jgi:predicted  nucleic acid-binding Zn-ribbon protein